MLIAERAKACYVQHEKLPSEWFEPEPAGGEHSQEMSARKNQHVAFHRAHAADDAVGSGCNLCRRFSVWATVAK
jgi:hypothetical protein